MKASTSSAAPVSPASLETVVCPLFGSLAVAVGKACFIFYCEPGPLCFLCLLFILSTKCHMVQKAHVQESVDQNTELSLLPFLDLQ